MSRLALIASAIALAPSAVAQETDHAAHAGHSMPAEPSAKTPDAAQPEGGHHDHMTHAGNDGRDMIVGEFPFMPSALGPYPVSRDASGTAWQPDAANHGGVHITLPDTTWMAMVHATVDTVYTSQGGPRGDDKFFAGGMVMGLLRGDVGPGQMQLRGAVSPDPLMGKSGYPLLLAAGETADGVDTLVDRQHPHDFFMELSASYSLALGDGQSVFVYGGLPGEPAFGPPAFMHRPAAMANPEAPITHHWMDSTHITYGVLTAGYVNGDVKIEASRFRGREPDQDRYDIETGELDSTALRLSWNPAKTLGLQASWADVKSPEQLEPDVDVEKWSASALYTMPLEGGGLLSFTGAFARKISSEDVTLDAWLGEASYGVGADWTLFARGEAIETDELGLIHHGPVENVQRLTLGVSRDLRISDSVVVAVGASVTQNWVSDALSPLYDGDPTGALAFVRFKIG